jgi:hypothetical protein
MQNIREFNADAFIYTARYVSRAFVYVEAPNGEHWQRTKLLVNRECS